jgi:8-oxo-dGTP pyrophosphatase MutT (NUDIX family)
VTREVTAWPAYDKERTSVRVILVDGNGSILLIDTHDPVMPEVGHWWELPGGGMEPGETVTQTAIREIAEETGLVLTPAMVEPTIWTRSVTYVRRLVRTLQHEHVVVARLEALTPAVSSDGRVPGERDELGAARWWTVSDIVAAAGATRFFPASLPTHLPDVLRGLSISEPFEFWN